MNIAPIPLHTICASLFRYVFTYEKWTMFLRYKYHHIKNAYAMHAATSHYILILPLDCIAFTFVFVIFLFSHFFALLSYYRPGVIFTPCLVSGLSGTPVVLNKMLTGPTSFLEMDNTLVYIVYGGVGFVGFSISHIHTLSICLVIRAAVETL